MLVVVGLRWPATEVGLTTALFGSFQVEAHVIAPQVVGRHPSEWWRRAVVVVGTIVGAIGRLVMAGS